MSTTKYILSSDRGLLHVGGGDAADFLQGMISNDINLVSPEKTVYAALLTPQGKCLFDFFVLSAPEGDGYFIDCEGTRLPDLQRRLTMYKLRADVTLEDVSNAWGVAVCFGDAPVNDAGATAKWNDGVRYVDPRLAGLGERIAMPVADLEAALKGAGYGEANDGDWSRHRLSLGVPEGAEDILVEKSLPLECSFDEMGAISYTKGCYVGQEMTARTHHRATLRKRLLPVHIEGNAPEAGTPIVHNEREVGEVRSVQGDQGMALFRIEYLSSIEASSQPDDVFEVDGSKIRPWIPDWVEIKPLDQE